MEGPDEQTPGDDPLEAAAHLRERAAEAESLGRPEEAEESYRRAIEIMEQHLGAEDEEVGCILNDLAEVERTLGKYREAGPLYRRAISRSLRRPRARTIPTSRTSSGTSPP